MSESLASGTPTQDYFAHLRVDAGDDWFPQMYQQVRDWLRVRKRLDVDVAVDLDEARGAAELTVRHRVSGGTSDMRMRLTERGTPQGTWTTDFLVHDEPGPNDWISLSVRNDQGRFVDVPRLATNLIEVLPVGDGAVTYETHPRILGQGSVEELAEILRDGDRHGLVFVAGTGVADGLSVDGFADRVATWTKQIHGLAQAFVLDPAATEALRELLGTTSAAPAWAIRTYLPGLDPTSRIDSRRHRMLGAERRSAMSDGQIRLLLGRIARGHAALRSTPSSVVRSSRAFDRLEDRRILQSIETPRFARPVEPSVPHLAPAGSTESVEDFLAQITLVKDMLGIDKIDATTIAEVADLASAPRADPGALRRVGDQVESLRDRVDGLEDELRLAQQALDDNEVERAELLDALHTREAESRWLRTRLRASGDFESASAVMPDDAASAYPQNFVELVERLQADELSGVVFTGDPGKTRDLDDYDTLGTAVSRCWDICRALSGYVAAAADHRFHGVAGYLKDAPNGFAAVPPGMHVPGEFEATMNQFGDERLFEVPADVSSTGYRHMTAHFRLPRIGMITPRVHYLDDLTTTGVVYVGYIGRHLRNTQTN